MYRGGVSACALGTWGDGEGWLLLIKYNKKFIYVFEHLLPFSRHLVWHQRSKWKSCKTRHQSKHLAPSLGKIKQAEPKPELLLFDFVSILLHLLSS